MRKGPTEKRSRRRRRGEGLEKEEKGKDIRKGRKRRDRGRRRGRRRESRSKGREERRSRKRSAEEWGGRKGQR